MLVHHLTDAQVMAIIGLFFALIPGYVAFTGAGTNGDFFMWLLFVVLFVGSVCAAVYAYVKYAPIPPDVIAVYLKHTVLYAPNWFK